MVPEYIREKMTPSELQLSIAGSPDIDVAEWQKHSEVLPPNFYAAPQVCVLFCFWFGLLSGFFPLVLDQVVLGVCGEPGSGWPHPSLVLHVWLEMPPTIWFCRPPGYVCLVFFFRTRCGLMYKKNLSAPFRLLLTGSSDLRLPSAHTCSFQLDLPQYSSAEILRLKVAEAITHNEFALA
jgi:hypothetical protein